jgi:probable DNA metabolism protein
MALAFETWRAKARHHLLSNTPPDTIDWDSEQPHLFGTASPVEVSSDRSIKLPAEFLEHARTIALFRDPNRWALLYRIAWRLQNENRNLLHIEVDDDVRAVILMRKAIARDIHKMRAFVRFRRVLHEGQEQFVAWYPPDHYILETNAPFFINRFGSMRFAILTPDASLIWDLEKSHYGPGVPRSQAPAEDDFDDLWRAYYASIYNPARRNLDAMRAEMPVRRWIDLPESRIIPELVRTSREQVETMVRKQPIAAPVPLGANLETLRRAIHECHSCELCAKATQPVFGEGTERSRIMLVGEQPGDQEDLAGRPFIGPAGMLLNDAMVLANLPRENTYLTNAVKAFRFEERGKRRIHQKPGSGHIAACRPWLEAEIANVKPEVIVCLGASAAQSVLGRTAQIKEERGRYLEHRSGARVIVTYHPSAILRAPDERISKELRCALIEDLARARGEEHLKQ